MLVLLGFCALNRFGLFFFIIFRCRWRLQCFTAESTVAFNIEDRNNMKHATLNTQIVKLIVGHTNCWRQTQVEDRNTSWIIPCRGLFSSNRPIVYLLLTIQRCTLMLYLMYCVSQWFWFWFFQYAWDFVRANSMEQIKGCLLNLIATVNHPNTRVYKIISLKSRPV